MFSSIIYGILNLHQLHRTNRLTGQLVFYLDIRVLYLRYSGTVQLFWLLFICRSRAFYHISFCLPFAIAAVISLYYLLPFSSLGRCYCCYCYCAKPQIRQNVKRKKRNEKKKQNEIYLHIFCFFSYACQVSFHMCNCICICFCICVCIRSCICSCRRSRVSVVTSPLGFFQAVDISPWKSQLLTIYANIMSIYNILFAHTRL